MIFPRVERSGDVSTAHVIFPPCTRPDHIANEEVLLQLDEDPLSLPDDKPKLTSRLSTERQESAVVEAILSRLPSAPNNRTDSRVFDLSARRLITLSHQVALNSTAPMCHWPCSQFNGGMSVSHSNAERSQPSLLAVILARLKLLSNS